MFRFTIRDVLWLMVVVGMGAVWYLERDGSASLRSDADRLHRKNENLLKELELYKKRAQFYENQNEAIKNVFGAK